MKTIFIFNDSRPTDPCPRFTALGEDARLFATVEFDDRTHEYFRYAFGCAHELPANLEEGITKPLTGTRNGLFAAYDRIYGSGNWIPLWIESPAENEAWRNALGLFRSRAAIAVTPEPRFSDAALARIFEALTGTSAPSAPSTTRVVH